MQQQETVPKALKWLKNDLGSIARYIWLNVKDKFQREIHLRALLGDAYAQIEDEIENDVPCSVQDVSIREMSASAYGREFYNAQLFLLKNVDKIVKNQQNQEERTERVERALSLLMERQNDHEQAISDIKSTVESIAQEQKKFFNEFIEIQTTTVKEQNRLTDAVGQLQESLNGLIESTNEMKRKEDVFVGVEIGENARKFEKFIGRWKLVKSEENGVEKDISNRRIQSYTFEPVAEGVMWKRYDEDGSEYGSWILTTDKEIKNKLDKEGKRCDLVEFQSDGSFRWLITTYNVEGNHLILRWGETVVNFEKC